jgi:dsDNA-specific endonuclease/ATPase MutS2
MEEDFIQNGLIAYIEGDIEQSLDQFTKAINKNVKSYRYGGEGEGGMGSTVVILK